MRQQLSALIWKNYLIKKANPIDTSIEYLIPVLLGALIVVACALMNSLGQTDAERESFFENILMRSFLPLLSGNCCRFILNQIVKEREQGILQSLVAMNTGSITYGLSYFVVQQPLCILTSIFATIAFGFQTNVESSLKLFQIFLAFIVVCETYLVFSLMLTTLFNESKRSTQIGFMVLFLSLIPYQIVITAHDIDGVFWTFCWTPGTAPLLWIYNSVSKQPLSYHEDIPMAVSPIVTFLVYLYLDQVYTFKKPHCFFCRKSRKSSAGSEADLQLLSGENEGDVVLKVKNVTKKYKDSEVLKGVSMDIRRGETTCLIGNNGSGKTTLINILVGFVKPDSGDVVVRDHSVLDEIRAVREDIRLCQ